MIALLLEDEAMIALDVEATLTEVGFNVVTFAKCSDGERWLQDHVPAVAIIDMHLSDGPCTPVVQVLVSRNIPFVIHSGGGDRTNPPGERFERGTWIEKPSDPLG